jgi:outer membrane protein insertion porin family/translocation and assembly module TamA
MNGRWLAVVLVLLATPVRAITVDELPSGKTYRLSAVRIEGAESVGASVVRNAMVTRLPPWYYLWQRWGARVAFNPAIFRSDLRRVAQILQEAGYYDARVDHDLEVQGRRVTVILRVDEGEPTLVEEVGLGGEDFEIDAVTEAALRAEMALAPESIFTQEAYDTGRAAIEKYFAERGFAYVKVTKAATVDTAAHRARIAYVVRRGRPATFGDTEIVGLTKVDPVLVSRELGYEPGDAYDPQRLATTQARVFGLRLFRTVTVTPANLEAETGTVTVRVEVREGPAREIRLGAGYGDEDGVRGQARWQHYNFLGGGRQLGFRLKASEIEQEFGAEFRQPYFLGPTQTLIVPLIQSQKEEPGFTNLATSLTPRIERILTPTLRAAIGFGIERDDLSDVPDATIARLDDFESNGFLFGPLLWVERNTADDLVDPHRGSIVRLTLEQAGGLWGGDYTFARGLLEARSYLPLPGHRLLAGRVRVGAGDAFGDSGDVPLFRRFYAGGIDSTRGYGRHLVGPLNEFESPVGGRSLAEANLELRHPLWGPIGGVLFFDAGMVRRQPFSWAVEDLQYGTGVGLRYKTPVGPLRVDLGFPLDPPPGEPSWRIHFSIGQAF